MGTLTLKTQIMVAKVGHPRVCKVEARGSGHLHSKFATSLGYKRPKQTLELSDSPADKEDLPGQPDNLRPVTCDRAA